MDPADFQATGAVIVEEQLFFSLTTLCRSSGADPAEVQALVDEGLLEPHGSGPDDWKFSGQALPRARLALRLARELDLGWQGTALVMDLLAEIDVLRTRLGQTTLVDSG